eukprot:6831629-Pyramimonas_sp.AAC.2
MGGEMRVDEAERGVRHADGDGDPPLVGVDPPHPRGGIVRLHPTHVQHHVRQHEHCRNSQQNQIPQCRLGC